MTCPKCGADLDSDDFIEAEPDVGIMCSCFYCTACEASISEDGEEL